MRSLRVSQFKNGHLRRQTGSHTHQKGFARGSTTRALSRVLRHLDIVRGALLTVQWHGTSAMRPPEDSKLLLSRPDISNPVRELSKTMDAPAPAHLKEMYKLIRFVLSTKDYGLKLKLIKSIRKWVLKALSDSDFASDKETRISIFGYVIYFCGIPIAWRSKGMKSVVLSTTEAEYMALSEVVRELKFIVQLLQTMNITVELPITVHVDNVGAIWLSNNRNTGDRTKHIDIRTAFVKQYQEDGKIIIKFVKSEDNEADMFTKNTSSIIFQRHQEKLVWDKKEVIEDQ